MKVELMYFKPESGKFYTSGEYDSAFDEAWEIFNEVKGFRDAGRLPGLRAGAVDFDIVVDIPDRYPALLKRDYRSGIITEIEQMYGPHDRRFKAAMDVANKLRVSAWAKSVKRLINHRCSIRDADHFADCPECEADADYASAPHPSKHYELEPEREWGSYADDFDYDDA